MWMSTDHIWSKRRVLSVFLAAVFLSFTVGFASNGAKAAEKPLKIVATTGMIADAARNVGGVHVAVRALMGPGVDPHAYRQTRTDIVAMTKADAACLGHVL